MRHSLAVLVGLALMAAACGGGGDDPTTSPVGADPTLAPATTTSSPPTTSATTFTTEAYGIDDPPVAIDGDAAFVISEVVFGDDGYVGVTNIGEGSGSLSGYQLCQRPSYFGIEDVTVAPGETVYFTAGSGESLDGQVFEVGSRFGRLRASSGEMGLYSSGSFGSSDAIVSYVEWGSGSHGRSSVAVGAGIWEEGDFVPTTDITAGLALIAPDGVPGVANWGEIS